MTEKEKVYKVGITGSYGGLNLGDEAILGSIIDQLRKSLNVKITVFSRDPEDTKKRHGVENAVAVRDTARLEILPAIEELDLLIFGGGGILFDGEVPVFLREVQLAQEKGVPVMVYAISAGPLKDTNQHPLIRECLDKVSLLTVRDRKAQRLLEELGVKKEIIVTADPAFLLKPEPLAEDALAKEGIDEKRMLIGMSVREPGLAAPDIDEKKYHTLLANVADFMVDRFDADVVFVPMEKKATHDVQHSHAVVAQMVQPQRAHILKGDYTSGQVLTLMKKFDFAVGMRLHFLIFAAMQNVPFVALPYASKVHGLLEHFHLEMPAFEAVNPGRLNAHIDRLWDTRKSLQTQIKKLLPEVKEAAKQTHELAVKLLKGTPAEEIAPVPGAEAAA